MGNYDSSNGTIIVPYDSGSNDILGINENQTSFGVTTLSVATSKVSYVGVRSGSTGASIALYRNGAAVGLTGGSASVALLTTPIYILAFDNNGSIGGGAPLQIAAASIGGLLNATTAPAVSSSGGTTGTGLVPEICTYLTTIHGSC
jgi:hypothetical protein